MQVQGLSGVWGLRVPQLGTGGFGCRVVSATSMRGD